MTRTTPRLPDFVMIGAVKAATTWVAHQLRQHPGIHMPGPEPHYFSTEFGRGLGWYEGLFAEAGGGQAAGEKSADYLAHPLAPRRMARLIPHARLIVQLRNPVERAYSDYCMLFRRGTVTGPPERYFADAGSSEQPRFLADGLYGVHLARFLDHFSREQVRVLLHDDIGRAPERAIGAVCRHIGVPTRFAAAAAGERRNDSAAALLPLALRRLLAPAKPLARPLRGQRWFARLHATLARPVPYPPLTDDLLARLRDFYRDDVARLERLIGRDLSHWLTGESETMPLPAPA